MPIDEMHIAADGFVQQRENATTRMRRRSRGKDVGEVLDEGEDHDGASFVPDPRSRVAGLRITFEFHNVQVITQGTRPCVPKGVASNVPCISKCDGEPGDNLSGTGRAHGRFLSLARCFPNPVAGSPSRCRCWVTKPRGDFGHVLILVVRFVHAITRLRVPNIHGYAVGASDREPGAVGRKSYFYQAVIVEQIEQFLPRLGVPDSYPLVPSARRRDPTAVRRKHDATHAALMPAQATAFLTGFSVPDAHHTFVRGCGNPPTVRRASDRVNPACVAVEAGWRLA